MLRNVLLVSCLAGASAFSLAPSIGLRPRTDAVSPVTRSSLSAARTAIPARRSTLKGASVSMMAKKMKKVAIGVVGPGLVGGELLRQMEATRPLLEKQGIDLTVASISELRNGKSWMICTDKKGLTMDTLPTYIADEGAGEPGDLDKMADFLKTVAPIAVMFDTTASELVSDFYPKWLGKGVSVITPNKKVGSGPLPRYQECLDNMDKTGAMWGDETTVGAGLPILNTLRTDLINTGDTVESIEGIFSGTLSYIFNTYKPGMKFSDVIADAKGKGFTEPDPRDDLSGTDVARKVTILARQCGMMVELGDVPVQSLVPDSLKDWKPKEGEVMADAFIKEMMAFDDDKAAQIKAAQDKGMCLRFVGVVNLKTKKVSVELREYPTTHPFAGTQYADNICAFNTVRYTPQPLVVQGPGAGAAVTAAGIYADFLKIVAASP
ncbi:homoserine dehydrogenase-domain-containing protein [Baffinella frigidus]|nr:homoserine dehydrogenase-domain-containing protein [Cryptophyta sp. CCMP2293]